MLGTTTLLSVNAAGTSSAGGASHSPAISADGGTVAFISHATNLVTGVTNQLGEVYVRVLAELPETSGTTHWVTASHLISTWERGPASGLPIAYRATEPHVSDDGRFVTFKAPRATVRYDLHRPTNSMVSSPAGPIKGGFRFDDNPRLTVAATGAPLAPEPRGGFLVSEARALLGDGSTSGLVRVDWETLQTNVVWEPCLGCQGGAYQTNVVPVTDVLLTNRHPAGSGWARIGTLQYAHEADRVLFLANLSSAVFNEEGESRLYWLDIRNRKVALATTNRWGEPGPSLHGAVPALSRDGTRVAWDSPDDALLSDGLDLNEAWDVYLRDLDGAGALTTLLISRAAPTRAATTGTGLARRDPISLSADGRRMAFVSTDANLVVQDTNRWPDVFVRDRSLGTTLAVSLMSGTVAAAAPMLSADGRYMAFASELQTSFATNRALYWRDLASASNRLVIQSGSAVVSPPTLSPNGRFLAFSTADDFDPDHRDENGVDDVYMRRMGFPGAGDLVGGCVTAPGAGAPVSTAAGSLAAGAGASFRPSFSPDSARILFESMATNLLATPVPRTAYPQLYGRRFSVVTERECGGVLEKIRYGATEWISYDTSAAAEPGGRSVDTPLPGGGTNPRFSSDGRFVVFASHPGRVYRHDLSAGWIQRVTEVNGGRLTNFARATNLLVCAECAAPSVSGDGALVAYEVRLAQSTNIYLKDLASGTVELISENLDRTRPGSGESFGPVLSADGRFVFFSSRAADLVAADHNKAEDVFVRDRWSGLTHALSRRWDGMGTANDVSSQPVVSADGRTVAFQSFASDLAPGDYNGRRDVWVVTLAGPDTDGDGIEDALEVAYFDTLTRDGTGDFDGDGISDGAEIRAGTHPADGSSVLAVLAITVTAASPEMGGVPSVMVTWRSAPGRRYEVQFRRDLDTAWSSLPGEIITGASVETYRHVSTEAGVSGQTGFYRVRLVE
jgi:TolB protein